MALDARDRWNNLDEVRAEAVVCCRCDLCYTRTLVAFGEGPAPSGLMLVGEGPGVDEDRQGRPFVGRAGRLLDSLLLKAGISRNDVWITNVVRCRPVNREGNLLRNRPPRADETRACDLWFEQEYRFVSPRAVVCLGAVSGRTLIGKAFHLTTGRGEWQEGRNRIPTTATYHPAYALRLRGEDRRQIVELMVEDLVSAVGRIR